MSHVANDERAVYANRGDEEAAIVGRPMAATDDLLVYETAIWDSPPRIYG